MRGTSRDRAHRLSVHSRAHNCTFKSSTATHDTSTSYYVETSTKLKLTTLAHRRSLSHNAPCVWSPKNPHLTLPTGLNRSIAPHRPPSPRRLSLPLRPLTIALPSPYWCGRSTSSSPLRGATPLHDQRPYRGPSLQAASKCIDKERPPAPDAHCCYV